MTNGSAPVEISIEGIDELQAKFIAGDAIATQLLSDAMGFAVDYVAQDAATYPAETDANQPPPPYYIRGVGTQLANRNLQDSRQLGQNWQKEITLNNDGVVGTVSVDEGTVPYAPYVHGQTLQAGVLAGIGWRKVTQIRDDVNDRVQEYFQVATQLLVAFLNGG